jgi:hypothetical protein
LQYPRGRRLSLSDPTSISSSPILLFGTPLINFHYAPIWTAARGWPGRIILLFVQICATFALFPKRCHLFTNKQLKDSEENNGQHVDSYIFPHYPNTEHAHPPSQGPLAPNTPSSPSTSYPGSVPQPPYRVSMPNPLQYQEAARQRYPTRLPSGAPSGPQDPWPNPLYAPSGHPILCDTHAYLFLGRLADLCIDDHVGSGGVPTGHNTHTPVPSYRGPLLDFHEPELPGLRNEQYQPESRRPTTTPTSLWAYLAVYMTQS